MTEVELVFLKHQSRIRLFPILTIFLFLVFSFKPDHSYSAIYYFSSTTGHDNHTTEQARNPQTPWKSLTRLNKFFPSLTSGDSILLKRGDFFYGSIQVSKSGAVFAPIYLGAYGTGNNPVISGLTTIDCWVQVQAGLYEAYATPKGHNVIINNVQKSMGRYPNAGYLSFEVQHNNKLITDNQLTADINWAGAELVIRKNRWTIDRSKIIKHLDGTLFYEHGSKALPTAGFGYFIQNDIRTLDKVGEWYSDSKENKLYLYFGNNDPNNYQVETSTVTNLLVIKNFNNITIENLNFTGAGNNAFSIEGASNITLKNLLINYSGAEAILASYSPHLTVENCLIENSWSGGINLDAGCTNAFISGNRIIKTGLATGMGKSGTGTYEGITAFGDFTKIEHNTIDSTGYNGIYFGGNSSSVKNNFISYFCLTKDDGAGIYVGDWSETLGKTVEANIIINGIGNNEGTGSSTSLQAEGIYIDDNSRSVKITRNTIFSCANNGIKIHNARDILVLRNTVFNNGVQLRLEQDCNLPSSSLVRNAQVQGNIFFSKGQLQANASYSSHVNDINDFGRVDSNYYNLFESRSLSVYSAVNLNSKSTFMKHNTFSWMASTGNDKSSVEILVAAIVFEYNSRNTSRVVMLSGEYTDVFKNIYKNEITLAPYSSVVLFPVDSKFGLQKEPKNLLVAKL
jgi:hypothetical protein